MKIRLINDHNGYYGALKAGVYDTDEVPHLADACERLPQVFKPFREFVPPTPDVVEKAVVKPAHVEKRVPGRPGPSKLKK